MLTGRWLLRLVTRCPQGHRGHAWHTSDCGECGERLRGPLWVGQWPDCPWCGERHYIKTMVLHLRYCPHRPVAR